MMKVGIIGLGFMAVAHIKGYRQLAGVELTAVCNPSGRRLDGDLSDVMGNVGGQEPIRLDMDSVAAYRDLEAFLQRKDLSAISVCTPTRTHAAIVLKALKMGHNVICEKPLARSVVEARTIADGVASASGLFMPAMCLRFWPEWAWLKDAIESGRFGAVQAAHFRRVAEPPAWGQGNYFDGSASGGALFDLHVHDVDFVVHCFGRPKSVNSSGFSKVSGAIDHVMTQYEVESGACVSAEGSWAMTQGYGFNMAYTVVFERATVDYDLSRSDEPLRLYEEGHEKTVVPCDGLDGYAGELKYFLDCVKRGDAPKRVSIGDALVVTEVCAAEEESVLNKRPVAL